MITISAMTREYIYNGIVSTKTFFDREKTKTTGHLRLGCSLQQAGM